MEPISSKCVCTALRMTTRTVKSAYDQELAPAGLTQTSYTILSRLEDEGPFAISELADRLAMDRTTCSRELRPLLTAGHAEQAVGQDRRQRIITLTPAGRRQLEIARPRWQTAQQKISQAFGTQRASGLLAELHDLLRSASALT
ncbi:MAG: MarR family winged helix-turn-helix transcriptional regulator [Streptosporangiaceae bacterium]